MIKEIKEIEINESYQTVKVFDSMKVGEMVKVPYSPKRHSGIIRERSRRNEKARLLKKTAGLEKAFAVSEKEYPGYTTIMRLK